MRVVCIDNNSRDVSLTLGKVYIAVYYYENGFYNLEDDLGKTYSYSSHRFITLKESRRLKLKKIGI
jgi:hypothetical protein